MLSIIIADDEEGVIDLCKMLIEYPGVTVIGEARNGLELLDKIEELHPDAVLTDINMPGMTGLELIETAKEDFPSVKFVVISGYTDFEYVQTALRFGVWDYLLKPIRKKELNSILEKLDLQLISEQEADQQRQSISQDLEKNHLLLQEEYIRQLCFAARSGSSVQNREALKPSSLFDLSDASVACLQICVDNRMYTADAVSPALLQQAESVFSLIRSKAKDTLRDCVTVSDSSSHIFFLVIPGGTASSVYDTFLENAASEIRQFNNQNRFIHLTAGSSSCLPAREEAFPEVILQSDFSVNSRPERWGDALIRYRAEDETGLLNLPPVHIPEQLRSAITDQNEEKTFQLIRSVFDQANRSVPGSTFRMLTELLDYINQSFRLLPDARNIPEAISVKTSEILYEELTPFLIREHLEKRISQCFRKYQEYAQTLESGLIQKAKKYVAMHYAEGISLEDVARHVVLSPTYFSALFKSETGTGFIKYLQFVRMEQAKKLLRESSLRIDDIAREVGYHDLKYFNKVFRSETGVKPSEYRKMYS